MSGPRTLSLDLISGLITILVILSRDFKAVFVVVGHVAVPARTEPVVVVVIVSRVQIDIVQDDASYASVHLIQDGNTPGEGTPGCHSVAANQNHGVRN